MALVFVLMACGRASVAQDVVDEYQVKAAVIYSLTKFVEWPGPATGRFNICVLGADPFERGLESLEQRQVRGSDVAVDYLMRADAAVGRCRVLFVSSSLELSLESILGAIGTNPVLTIGDLDDFARRGGMVQLSLADGRVGLTINLEAAMRARVSIPAAVLELATIVGNEQSGGDR